jgi:hypothetical protein
MWDSHQSIIGLVLQGLRKLPSSKEAFFKLLLALLGLFTVLPVLFLIGNPTATLPKLLTGPAVAFGTLTLVLIGTRLRKYVDQRGGPGDARKKSIKNLLRPLLKPNPRMNGVYILLEASPPEKVICKFPHPKETDGLLKEVTLVNCAAFRGSAFEDTFDHKHLRNGSHQRKNPLALLLMGLPDAHFSKGKAERKVSGVQWVGFTHILPVDESTYIKYINGQICDKDFGADLVCRRNEPAFALILFSLGLDLYRLKQLYGRIPRAWLDTMLFHVGIAPDPGKKLLQAQRFLWMGLLFHISKILNQQSLAMPTVKLVAQSFNQKIIDILEAGNFTELKGRISCDKEQIFEITIQTGKRSQVA